jgi:hypothetical protein
MNIKHILLFSLALVTNTFISCSEIEITENDIRNIIPNAIIENRYLTDQEENQIKEHIAQYFANLDPKELPRTPKAYKFTARYFDKEWSDCFERIHNAEELLKLLGGNPHMITYNACYQYRAAYEALIEKIEEMKASKTKAPTRPSEVIILEN